MTIRVIIKTLVNIIFISLLFGGLIVMISETPSLAINGGGMITFLVSLLILSKLNGDCGEPFEQKGGKYYGIR